MGEKKSKVWIIVIICLVVVLIAAAVVAYVMLNKPAIIIKRALNNAINQITDSIEIPTSGMVKSNIKFTTDLQLPLMDESMDIQDLSIQTEGHFDGDNYLDYTANVKYGDMALPEVFLAIVNKTPYIKIKDMDENLYTLDIKDKKVSLEGKHIKDLVIIAIDSIYEQEVVKASEKITIDGEEVSVTKNSVTINKSNIDKIYASITEKIKANSELKTKLDSFVGGDYIEYINYAKEYYTEGTIKLDIYSKELGKLVGFGIAGTNDTETAGDIKVIIGEENMLVYLTSDGTPLELKIDYSDLKHGNGNALVVLTANGTEAATATIECTSEDEEKTTKNNYKIAAKVGSQTIDANLSIDQTIDTAAKKTKVDISKAKTMDEFEEKISALFSGMMETDVTGIENESDFKY